MKAYTGPNNPIHFDPEIAKRSGFRVPIIGGGQGVRFLTAEIWRRFRPQTMDFDVNFRWPIFWDDTVTVMVDERGGEWRAICLVKGGKVATNARRHLIRYVLERSGLCWRVAIRRRSPAPAPCA